MGSLINYERPGSESHQVWGQRGAPAGRWISLQAASTGGWEWGELVCHLPDSQPTGPLPPCPLTPPPQETKGSVAVRVALGETQLVQEVRRFLIENGVSLDSFSQVSTRWVAGAGGGVSGQMC